MIFNEIMKNSKGEDWTLDCRFPMQLLIREITPKDIGKTVRLRHGAFGLITGFKQDREFGVEVRVGEIILYMRIDGLSCKQTWRLAMKLSALDIVSFV